MTRLELANKIIERQGRLIELFDKWVLLIKGHDLEGASDVVTESNELRKEIMKLKKEAVRKAGILLVKK